MGIDSLKKLLQEQQKRFEQRLDTINQDESWLMENSREAQRLEIQGLFDESQVMSSVIRAHSQKLLEQTKQSISRLDNGMYGICIKCRGEIELERLQILPTTTFCKKCK